MTNFLRTENGVAFEGGSLPLASSRGNFDFATLARETETKTSAKGSEKFCSRCPKDMSNCAKVFSTSFLRYNT